MGGTSKKSKVISVRLPNEVIATLERRVNGRRSRWDSVGQYLRERIEFDTMRPHGEASQSTPDSDV